MHMNLRCIINYCMYHLNVSCKNGSNTSNKVEVIQKLLFHWLKCECIMIVHGLCGCELKLVFIQTIHLQKPIRIKLCYSISLIQMQT